MVQTTLFQNARVMLVEDSTKFDNSRVISTGVAHYNDFCALDMQFGPGASMMDQKFWIKLLRGWEAADLQSKSARTWFDAMVDHQVNMGTTLDVLWTSKCGVEKALQDQDRRYIPPAALARQKALAARYMRKQDDIGTIAPGCYADLLVVDGDPLRDVRELRKLTTVYRGGVAHDPQTLLGRVPQREAAQL